MIYSFFDGASLQYEKRKNFINLCYHNDSITDVMWHSFASHMAKVHVMGLKE
jgi:hypothetical protein